MAGERGWEGGKAFNARFAAFGGCLYDETGVSTDALGAQPDEDAEHVFCRPDQ
jgi:hypothetical protein